MGRFSLEEDERVSGGRFSLPEVATFEYQPVPTAPGGIGNISYGVKRALGGPLMRFIEVPQQYVYAAISSSIGTIPEDWTLGSPFARIAYPGRFKRITEAALTGTEDFATNLPVALLLDPWNIAGGLGAITKLGKAAKLVRGLSATATATRRFGYGEKAADKMMKYLRASKSAPQLEKRMTLLLDKGGDIEKYRPVIDKFKKVGKKALFEPATLSEAISAEHATVFGIGRTTGFGGVAEADIAAGLRKPVAGAVSAVEQAWHGMKPWEKVPIKATTLARQAGKPVIAEYLGLNRFVQRLRDSYKAESIGKAVKDGRYYQKEFVKAFEDAGISHAELAGAITGRVNTADNPVLAKYANTWHNLMDDMVYKGEIRYKDYVAMEHYIPRILNRNKQGESMGFALYEHTMGKAAPLMRKMGVMDRFKFYQAMGGDPFISVTNLHQMARAVTAPSRVKEMQAFVRRMAVKANKKGDNVLASDFSKISNELEHFIESYDMGMFARADDPWKFNTTFRDIFKKEISEFADSPAGKRFGLKAGSPLSDFKYWSEDFGQILPMRLKAHAETMTAGRIIERYFREFGFNPKVADSTGKLIDNPEFIMAERLADDAGQRIVPVKKYLEERLGRTSGSINKIIGRIGDDVHMDTVAAEGFAQVLRAWEKIPATQGYMKIYDKVQNWWARSTLFGGRASYVWNNLTGDRWNMMLAGARPKYISGYPAWQIMLDEGKGLRGLPAYGVSDDTIVLSSMATGKQYTKREVLDLISQHGVDGGLFESEVFQAIDSLRFTKDTDLLTVKNAIRGIKEGDLLPGMRHFVSIIEKNGRYNLFMHFLEEGLNPADAAQKVAEFLFDYTKQNRGLRRIAPFHYWTWKNTPLQFRNMFKQPAKIRVAQKVQYTADVLAGDEPFDEARPEYLETKGVYCGQYGGKDIYFDMANIPVNAAQDMLGLLEGGGFGDMVTESFKNIATMTGPFIQVGAELAMKREFFTERPIIGGGAGVMPERGIREFVGFRIDGNPTAQIGAHILESFITPLQMVQSHARLAKKLPPALLIPKIVLGVPIRQVDRDSAEWINLQEERNRYVILAGKYEDLGKSYMQKKYEDKAEALQGRLNVLNKRLAEKRKR